jgi:hypothetical protein
MYVYSMFPYCNASTCQLLYCPNPNATYKSRACLFNIEFLFAKSVVWDTCINIATVEFQIQSSVHMYLTMF